jgi:hypothetical protein
MTAAAALMITASAQAHEGHDLSGAHWHASEAWGLVALAMAVAVALYLSRSGKP